jgi:hypothetical protein
LHNEKHDEQRVPFVCGTVTDSAREPEQFFASIPLREIVAANEGPKKDGQRKTSHPDTNPMTVADCADTRILRPSKPAFVQPEKVEIIFSEILKD